MTLMAGNLKQEQNKVIFSFDDITFTPLFDGYETYFSENRADFIAKLFNSSLHLYQDGIIDQEDLAGSIIENLLAFEGWIWVVYEKDTPVGLIGVDAWEWAGDYLHSCSFHTWVARDGLFCTKAMLKAGKYILEYLKNRGLTRVYTYIDQENQGGIKFYEKMGFEKEGLLRARVRLNGVPRNEYILAAIFI